MEGIANVILSFILVCVVSSFCVAIGIGGGILYVPIIGILYSHVQKGVYLSKVSIFMTSLIGSSYHLWNDGSTALKSIKKNRLLKKSEKLTDSPRKLDENYDSESNVDKSETVSTNSDLETKTHKEAEQTAEQHEELAEKSESLSEKPELDSKEGSNPFEAPRVYLVLSISLIPFCILGSYVGTTFHFFAKEQLKHVITVIVSICLLLTLLKLIVLYINRDLNSDNDSECAGSDLKLNLSKNSKSNSSEISELGGEQKEMESESKVEDIKITYEPSDLDQQESDEVYNSDSKLSVSEETFGFFKPYNNINVHRIDKRMLSFIMVVLCLLLYYLSIRLDKDYLYAPVFIVLLLLGLYYSIKTRLTFKPIKRSDRFSRKVGKFKDKIYRKIENKRGFKCLDAGVHYILLNALVAFLSGFFSGSVGTGSGIFMVPLLQYLSVSPVSCTATSNFLTLTMSIATLSRFGLKVEFKAAEVLPVLFGSLVGTSISLFLIRKITKDKISAFFVNFTLLLFCFTSIIITWAI